MIEDEKMFDISEMSNFVHVCVCTNTRVSVRKFPTFCSHLINIPFELQKHQIQMFATQLRTCTIQHENHLNRRI